MFVLPNSDIGYLEALLYDENRQLRVLPYADLADVPQEHLSQFCAQQGVYCIPTLELVDFLRAEIAGEKAIEIGAGNGALGTALGIPITDSRMQEEPQMRRIYADLQQATVRYGPNVQRYDAADAIRRFKPHTVIAAWVTHQFDSHEAWRKGSIFGVDEGALLRRVRRYIFIGNEEVHGPKPVLERPHRTVHAEWLLSRAMNGTPNAIWIWERDA